MQRFGLAVATRDAPIVPTAPRLGLMLDEKERAARLAYWLRDVRVHRNISPPELASRIGASRGTINKWEAAIQIPSMIWLGPICSALSVDPRLFADLPPIPPTPASEYLVGEAVAEGLEQGKTRARRPRAGEAPSAPQPLRPPRSPANGR